MAVADLAAQALEQIGHQATGAGAPCPGPLPTGWIMKESRSQPGYYYYYNQETFEKSWDPPMDVNTVAAYQQQQEEEEEEAAQQQLASIADQASLVADAVAAVTTTTNAAETTKDQKRPQEEENSSSSHANKKAKTSPSSSSSAPPKEVRVLHILKKHKDSRRPSSWRVEKITQTREEAREELEGLVEILQEERVTRVRHPQLPDVAQFKCVEATPEKNFEDTP